MNGNEETTTATTTTTTAAASETTTKPIANKTKKPNGEAKAGRSQRPKVTALPNVDELRLAPNGVKAEDRNRYINVEFTNGFVVRLFPVGFDKGQVPKVRDLLVVAWMNKRLGRSLTTAFPSRGCCRSWYQLRRRC